MVLRWEGSYLYRYEMDFDYVWGELWPFEFLVIYLSFMLHILAGITDDF